MMKLNSAIYEGRIRHNRLQPREHRFEYRIFMMYLDLAELETVFKQSRLWSLHKPALARFVRRDYFHPESGSLDEALRGYVEQKTGLRPRGPIRMLTHLRYFGFVFNPVTFYYFFDESGLRLETVLSEITNTPWNERHAYLLHVRDGQTEGDQHHFSFAKAFHVSPFMPMEQQYHWGFQTPGPSLSVHMQNVQQGALQFEATLDLKRKEISTRSLNTVLLRFPFMTLAVVAGIYLQALKLKLKNIPFFDHPKHRLHNASEEKIA